MSTPTTPIATTALVQEYLAAWNETDPAARRAAVDAVTVPDVRYVDPLADVAGAGALDALIAAVQQQFAALPLTLDGEVDAHHDVCRFRWRLGPVGEEPLVIGSDVVTLAPDGRIAAVHGFLDRVPPGA